MPGELVPQRVVEVLGEVGKRVDLGGEVGVNVVEEELVYVFYVPAVELDQSARLAYHTAHVVVRVPPQEDVVGVVRLGVVGVVEVGVGAELLLAQVAADRPDPVELST